MERKRKSFRAVFTVLVSTVLMLSSLVSPVFAKQGYFYSQLSAIQKKYFNELDNNASLKNGTSTEADASAAGVTDKNDAWKASDAFLLDNANIFWWKTYGYDIDKLRLGKAIDWNTGKRKSKLSDDIAKVNAQVKSLANAAKKKSTVKEKLLYVHDWIVDNNDYNETAAYSSADYEDKVSYVPWTPLSALLQGESPVCEGYSKAFKLVCDELGIPCILVSGTAYEDGEGGAHMWNEVQIDGKWYAVDATWDDPLTEPGSNIPDWRKHSYFLVGGDTVVNDGYTEEKFNKSHVPNKNAGLKKTLTYPKLNATEYKSGSGTKKVTKITLSATTKTMNVGDSFTLKATIAPKDASNKDVTWKSDNEKVATVTNKGVVKCVGNGTATITVKAKDGSNVKKTCKITGYKKATGVTIKPSSVSELKVGDSVKLKATVNPKGSDQTVTWGYKSKSDKNIVTVSKTGKVTAKKVGTATVTAKTANGKTAKCKITVKPQEVTKIAFTKDTINKAKKGLALGSTLKLKYTITPSTASNKNVSWSSKPAGIVTIKNGIVTPKKVGKVSITVTAKGGKNKKATLSLEVK